MLRDKSQWKATSSGFTTGRSHDFAIDNVRWTEGDEFFGVTNYLLHWLQVDLGGKYLVTAVQVPLISIFAVNRY